MMIQKYFALSVLSASLLGLTACGSDSPGGSAPSTNIKPIAVISGDMAQNVLTGQKLSLSAESSTDDHKVSSWLWQGSALADPVTTEQVELNFATPGIYTLTLTVTDDEGNHSEKQSITFTVTTPAGNQKPVIAIASMPTKIKVGKALIVKASDSYDPEGSQLSFAWDNDQTDSSATYTFNNDEIGQQTITLTVTDADGISTTKQISIEVIADDGSNSNPVAHLSPANALEVTVGNSQTFDASDSFDPDDDELEYKWSTGETTSRINKTFDQLGQETITVTLTDGHGGNTQASVEVTVVAASELAAVISPATQQSANINEFVSLSASNSIGEELSYIWSDDTNPEQSGEQASFSYTSAGLYTVTLTITDKLNHSSTQTLTIKVEDAGPRPDDKPDPMQLGAVYTRNATTFRIWSPDSSNVTIRVDGNEHSLSKVSDFDGYNNIYEVVVNGDLHLAEYTFSINGTEVRDPYGKMAKPQSQTNAVLNMAMTDLPGGWAPTPKLDYREDAIIYEVHVRDFTIDSSSGVSAGKNGKYMGMVESGTTYQNIKTGIDHLLELGVTHVQLLPVYDYGTCDGQSDCFNWGYDPRNYSVPEDSYSQYNGDDYVARVKEFKMMVNEFHKAGLRVIMDVVYNHTYANEMFENITGQYYTSSDLSGTGNSINTNVPMVSRMVQDSLDYWVNEYNIDGFRFDLIGIFNYASVEDWGRHINDKYSDRNILMYGEPWNGYASDPDFTDANGNILRVRYGTTHNMVEEHVGVFNGAYREAIKGKNDTPECGFMCNNMNNGNVDGGWGVYDGLRGSLKSPGLHEGEWGRLFTEDPEQSINYISAHDNYGLWDKVYLATASYVKQKDPDNGNHQIEELTPPSNLDYSKRVVDFGMGMVLASQGIPFIHAGDEFLRTKTYGGSHDGMANKDNWNDGYHGGSHNTYNLSDDWNKIRWGWKVDNAATFNYFKDLIAVRKAHSGFRMHTKDEINDYFAGNTALVTSSGGHLIAAHSTYPNDNELYIVFNNGSNTQVDLPAGSWTQIADASGASNESGLSGSVSIEGTAVTIFRKD